MSNSIITENNNLNMMSEDQTLNHSHVIDINLNDFRVCWRKTAMDATTDDLTRYIDLDELTFKINNDYDSIKSFHDLFNNQQEQETNDVLNKQVHIEFNRKSAEIIENCSQQTQNINQILEQITLYNKYTDSQQAHINVLTSNDTDLVYDGNLKLHWNLKKPIQLATESSIPLNFISKDNTNRKAANNLVYDDSVLPNNDQQQQQQEQNTQTSSSTDDKQTFKSKLFRSKTISYNKSRESSRLKPPPVILEKSQSRDNQLFIPTFASTSSIRIDNKTTCLKAIEILFDKYHITSSPNDFALYKMMQTGEKRQLNDDECPLTHRLFMGPFSEDRIFIMEKGVDITNKNSILLASLICLPESLLNGLLETVNREEENEIEHYKQKYSKYREKLIDRLNSLEQYV